MNENIIHVQKWSSPQPPDEETLHRQLAKLGLKTFRWTGKPGEVYHAQAVDHSRIIYVVQGSITFGFPIEAEPTTLRAGDRLDLPAGVPHNAAVGFDGVICLEANRA